MVEFIGWVVVLVVPVIYLVLALAQVQAASFAVASAADAAARILSTAEDDGAAVRAEAAARLALEDQRIALPEGRLVEVRCADAGCTRRAVTVTAGVDLPVLSSAGIGRDVVLLDASRIVTAAERRP